MPNLLILTTRKLNTAPRVLREIQALAETYTIHTVGHTPPDSISPDRFIDASNIRQSFVERIVNILARLLRMNPPIVKSISKRLSDLRDVIESIQPDIIIAHEPHFLPYLRRLKKTQQFKIVYNAHEYHPLEFSDYWYWNLFWKPYFMNIYHNCLPSVDLFINVCDSIAQKCYDEFGKESIVIPNACTFHDLKPVNASNNLIKIIHHGGSIPNRKIEIMINVAKLLGTGYQLDLMLSQVDEKYMELIRSLASKVNNVNIIPTVKFTEIVPFTNQYDIGLYILPPTNYNDSVALPNKLFEFIQARLCIAIGPSPEMSNIVKKYDLGVVSDDFTSESMAKAIRSMTPMDIDKFKEQSHKAAFELSAEKFSKLLVDSINNL